MSSKYRESVKKVLCKDQGFDIEISRKSTSVKEVSKERKKCVKKLLRQIQENDKEILRMC